ncbi:hypothetical protein C8R47DRAFT_1079124 [Mycena vitilis]|nr:hypothetical protein C8R47DRAFT_1079124 [Mycena vitilis]
MTSLSSNLISALCNPAPGNLLDIDSYPQPRYTAQIHKRFYTHTNKDSTLELGGLVPRHPRQLTKAVLCHESVKHYMQFLRYTEFVVQEAVQPAECGFDLVGIPHFEHSPVSVRPLTNQPQQLQSTHTTFVDTPDDLPNLRCCWRLNLTSVGEVCSQKKASKAANLTELGGTGGLQEVIPARAGRGMDMAEGTTRKDKSRKDGDSPDLLCRNNHKD